MGLAHLDRPFDYLVPDTLADVARPGVRVRVRFAGRLVDGWLLERGPVSDHGGRLSYLERVVSAEPVLTPAVLTLARAVADHWGGSFVDVARLAVPPRHARVEAEPVAGSGAPVVLGAPVGLGGWAAYPSAGSFFRAVGAGRAPRAVWTALPGEDWPARLAEAAALALAAGRGALLVVPDHRDLARVDVALTHTLGPGRHVALSADLGPAERYRRWLRVLRGGVQVAVGTRAVVYAPVRDLGLLAIWDDGDDLYDEPRAPYAHARDVLVMRAQQAGAAAVLAAAARSVEAAELLRSGWAKELVAARPAVRARMPHVAAAGDDEAQARDAGARTARLPSVAWRAAAEATAADLPVLVQVPRRGYVPALACARCRTPARCAHCAGPLALPGAGADLPACRWCARVAAAWACPTCGHRRLRAMVIGARRTAEELGRAFPGVAVATSGRDAVLDRVPARAALVVTTPGAEPVADGGYGAALLLDGWALLARPDLRAGEETLRRWLNAATLVRAGGPVVVVADAAVPAVQALVRWQPGWLAGRELDERRELGFPPVARFAALTGTPAGVADLLSHTRLPEAAELLGPVAIDADRERMLIRVPRIDGPGLAHALHAGQASRSARKEPDPVTVRLDPVELI